MDASLGRGSHGQPHGSFVTISTSDRGISSWFSPFFKNKRDGCIGSLHLHLGISPSVRLSVGPAAQKGIHAAKGRKEAASKDTASPGTQPVKIRQRQTTT